MVQLNQFTSTQRSTQPLPTENKPVQMQSVPFVFVPTHVLYCTKCETSLGYRMNLSDSLSPAQVGPLPWQRDKICDCSWQCCAASKPTFPGTHTAHIAYRLANQEDIAEAQRRQKATGNANFGSVGRAYEAAKTGWSRDVIEAVRRGEINV